MLSVLKVFLKTIEAADIKENLQIRLKYVEKLQLLRTPQEEEKVKTQVLYSVEKRKETICIN